MIKHPLFSLSQVIPYGVGSLQMRLRRDVQRCQCTDRRDTKCVRFCSYLDLQHEWVPLLISLYLTHIVAAVLYFTDALLAIFRRDEKASIKRYHPRNYKERYNSRFSLRRRRNHNPVQTTWEKWKKLLSNLLCSTIWAASLTICLNMCAVNGLRRTVLDVISITLACHEMLASQ